jgi:hypothetical protein
MVVANKRSRKQFRPNERLRHANTTWRGVVVVSLTELLLYWLLILIEDILLGPMTEAEANGVCANQWGTMMKLTSAQIERTLRHFDAQAIPESHPLLPRLNELFGDHTFFVDSNGLSIMEVMTEPADEGTEVARGTHAVRVVNVADGAMRPIRGLLFTSPSQLTLLLNLS